MLSFTRKGGPQPRPGPGPEGSRDGQCLNSREVHRVVFGRRARDIFGTSDWVTEL